MLAKLNKYYNRQSFHPDFLSILVNPFYIIRKGMLRMLKTKTPLLTGKMMDFGCGVKPYRTLFCNVSEYVGVDIENEAHSHEKEEVDVYYSGKTLPFENDQFDSVFSSEVFEHVFNLDEILLEMNRVLKKGGTALFTVPFVWGEHEIPFDFGRYTSFGSKHLFEKAGFEVMSVEKNGSSIGVIHQLLIEYVRNLLFTKNKYINILINIVFISPLTISGIIATALFPKNNKLYFNNIVLVRKKQ
jgi:SAM-dependent methyltransferase